MATNFFNYLLKGAIKSNNNNELKHFVKAITTLGGTAKQLFRLLITKPSLVSKKLGKLSKEERKEIGQEYARNQGTDFSFLSSSWMISGEWEGNPLFQVGELTITTTQGKSYTYPSVPLMVWEAMKKAKGRNGSGAGSVFWNLYLHSYKQSASKQKIALAFKIAGVK